MGPLLRSPHSQCLLSQVRRRKLPQHQVHVLSASVRASVRLSWAGGIGETMCFSLSLTRSGGVEALPGAQAPRPQCAGSASWSESARLLPGLSWSQRDVLRGPPARWWLLPIGARGGQVRLGCDLRRTSSFSAQTAPGARLVRGASLWGVQRAGPPPGLGSGVQGLRWDGRQCLVVSVGARRRHRGG